MSKQNNEPAEVGHNRVVDVKKLKEFEKQWRSIKQRQEDARMDMLALGNKVEDAGIDRKDFKQTMQIRWKEPNIEHLAGINALLEALGGLPLFNHALTKELEEEAA